MSVQKSVAFIVFACSWAFALQAQTLVSGHGIKIDAKEIKSDLERAPEGAKESLSKPEALQTNVSNMLVRRTLAKDALKAGIDKNPLVAAAIEKAKERILSDAMLENIDQKNQPGLKDIEAYAQASYKANPKRFEEPEQVRASHILIRTGEQDAKAKMESILQELKAGADFAEVAKARSQDPGSAAKGGDLGFFGKGRMIKPFEDTVFAMTTPGQLSGVFESPFGYHIIKLVEKKPAGVKMFAEVKDTLMKEAQAAILNEGRFKEQDRILKDAKFDTAAIEALAKEFAKP